MGPNSLVNSLTYSGRRQISNRRPSANGSYPASTEKRSRTLHVQASCNTGTDVYCNKALRDLPTRIWEKHTQNLIPNGKGLCRGSINQRNILPCCTGMLHAKCWTQNPHKATVPFDNFRLMTKYSFKKQKTNLVYPSQVTLFKHTQNNMLQIYSGCKHVDIIHLVATWLALEGFQQQTNLKCFFHFDVNPPEKKRPKLTPGSGKILSHAQRSEPNFVGPKSSVPRN